MHAKPSSPVELDTLFLDASIPVAPDLISPTLETYQRDALTRMNYYTDAKGLDILEVGADNGNCLARLQGQGMKRGLGINNWRWPDWERPRRANDRIILSSSEIGNLPVRDESFDLIYSIATYEHIHDLPGALAEMHRLVKVGGLVYAIFGPIWTSLVGHHLWFDYRGKEFRFTDSESIDAILDPYDHLLYSREELRRKLLHSHDEEATEKILYEVFDSPHINRYTYADYFHFVLDSPFETINFKTTWEIPVSEEYRERLEQKCGGRIDCSCAGLEIVLRKKGESDE
jgi:SAM-dependent methyltransferase